MPRRRPPDAGAMPVALLLTVVGVALSGVLASTVARQIGAARAQVERVHALDAAQAGLDIAVGHIRAANDGHDNGVLSALPCTPLTGQVGAGGAAAYRVTIAYLNAGGAAIVCVPGYGAASTPVQASLVAVGTDHSTGASRTLQATYQFRTTNRNIIGGLVHVYQTSISQDLCLDAGSADPAAGTALIVQPCATGSPPQMFSYTKNLTLTLVSSIGGSLPTGMCLDGGPVPHGTDGAAVTFQPCGGTVQPRQQWGYNDNANFEGASNATNLDGYCFNVQFPDSAASPVLLRTGNNTCHQNYTNVQNFSPEPQAGAGAAGTANTQLVNFREFGRCLEVTNLSWGYSYMIVGPCEQTPDPAQVTWDQKWVTPAVVDGATGATGSISTKPSYESFSVCLTSPLSTAGGQYVTLTQCPAGALPTTSWTMYGDTGVYQTSYTIVDDIGNCLAATDPNAATPDLHPGALKISKLVVVTCSGSTLEKWNASPRILQATPLKDILER